MEVGQMTVADQAIAREPHSRSVATFYLASPHGHVVEDGEELGAGGASQCWSHERMRTSKTV